MNIYEADIPENQPDGKLSVYLSRALPLLPEHVLRDAFKNRDVKQDGARMSADAALVRGAHVQVYTPWEASLPIIYEDDNILVIDKPAGLSTDDDARGGMTVLSFLTQRAKGAYTPRLCHRLDNQTGGLMVLAKNEQSEACLLEAFKERSMSKRYVCLARGTLRPRSAVCDAYLVKDAAQGKVRVVSHGTPEAKPIRTAYETLSEKDGISRVLVTLLTGRTHQIRAHMAYLAHPILGDDLYGDRALNRRLKASRLMLCAVELTLNAGGPLAYLNGKTFSINAPF